MGKTYSVANRKGGCSKTTTVGALASGLNELGCKVLVVDMDPQGNISDWAGFNTDGQNTTYEVITNRCEASEAIYETKHYDLMPADNDLFASETELANAIDRYEHMRDALKSVKDDYNFILIDTPPNLSTLSINAFVASDGGIIVTTDTGAFSTKGMNDLAETLAMVSKKLNPQAKVIGILLTRFNPRFNAMKVMREVTEKFSAYFEAPVYDTFIRQSVAVMECQMESVDLFDAPKQSAAIADYRAFVAEFLHNESAKEQESEK